MSQPLNIEPFRDLAAQQQSLVRRALRLYGQEIDAILRRNCTDPHRIESQLDSLLGFCFDPEMLLLFKRLCRHYCQIDPKATADYIRFYREMWDEDRETGDA